MATRTSQTALRELSALEHYNQVSSPEVCRLFGRLPHDPLEVG